MSDELWRIKAPHFVAGLTFGGVVTKAAPILRYMLGWSRGEVIAYCNRKGWRWEPAPDSGCDGLLPQEK